MTGKTHRMGGMLMSVVGFEMLRRNGLLMADVNEAIQWLAIFPFCYWGSTASDHDQNWESCPSRDPISWGLHKALHITEPLYTTLNSRLTGKQKRTSFTYKFARAFNARHRSWQTHSDLTLIAILYLLHLVMTGQVPMLSAKDMLIATPILTGLCLGIASHLLLDMLTPEGVWCSIMVLLNKFIFRGKLPHWMEKWHFVPNWKVFHTGSTWEEFVYKVLRVLTYLAFIYLVLTIFFADRINSLMSLIPYRIEFTNPV